MYFQCSPKLKQSCWKIYSIEINKIAFQHSHWTRNKSRPRSRTLGFTSDQQPGFNCQDNLEKKACGQLLPQPHWGFMSRGLSHSPSCDTDLWVPAASRAGGDANSYLLSNKETESRIWLTVFCFPFSILHCFTFPFFCCINLFLRFPLHRTEEKEY